MDDGPLTSWTRKGSAPDRLGRREAKGSDLGEGNLGCIGLLIADKTVDPGVDDFDGELVAAGLENLGDIGAIGCMSRRRERLH